MQLSANDEDRKGKQKQRAFEAHCGYYVQYGGSGKYEHQSQRFEEGFERGWDDAVAFFGFEMKHSVSEIGFKGQWAKRLLVSHIQKMKERRAKIFGNLVRQSLSLLMTDKHGVVQGVNIDAATNALLPTRILIVRTMNAILCENFILPTLVILVRQP